VHNTQKYLYTFHFAETHFPIKTNSKQDWEIRSHTKWHSGWWMTGGGKSGADGYRLMAEDSLNSWHGQPAKRQQGREARAFGSLRVATEGNVFTLCYSQFQIISRKRKRFGRTKTQCRHGVRQCHASSLLPQGIPQSKLTTGSQCRKRIFSTRFLSFF